MAEPTRRATLSGRWLVTFADLSAVMVAFFVLMFSMSEVDIDRWEGAVEAFNRRFDVLAQESPVARPQAERNVLPVERVPATDVSYLAALLQRQFEREVLLRPARLTLFQRELVVSMAPELMFDGGRLSRQGRGLLFVLSGLLGAVDNGLDIIVHDEDGDGSRWQQSIERAELIADSLRDAGYPHAIRVAGYGAREDPILPRSSRLAAAGRIDIVIAEDRDAP